MAQVVVGAALMCIGGIMNENRQVDYIEAFYKHMNRDTATQAFVKFSSDVDLLVSQPDVLPRDAMRKC